MRTAALPGLIALAVAILSGAAALPVNARSEYPATLQRRLQEFVPGEVIVRFRPAATAAARAALLQQEKASLQRPLPLPDTVLLRLAQGRSPREAAAALRRRPEVLYAEPNWRYRYLNSPNDPRFPQLWGLHQANDADIDAPGAWDITTGSSAVIVAVTDSGVAYQHPDLAPNIWTNDDPPDGFDNDNNGFIDDTHGWDFADGENTPFDTVGHGTHVAGTIGARGNNALGVAGVNWQVSLMPVRVGDEAGPTVFGIVSGFAYACANGARVVNGSFGGPNSQAIQDAVLACPQVLFVFAAGNDGVDLDVPGFDAFPCELHLPPASAPNVLCVAASTQTDTRAFFSNHGTTAVHLAAPGQGILSSVPGVVVLPGFPDSMELVDFDTLWGDRTFQLGNKYWDHTTQTASHGGWSVTDSPGIGVNYTDNTFSTIRRMPSLDLSGRTNCRVSYDMRLDTELGFDYFVVFAGPSPETDRDMGGWSGSTNGQFVRLSNELIGLNDEPVVYVRLGLVTDSSITGDGVYIDQLAVECSDPTAEAYEFFDGTSMATPHVVGVAALLLAQDPSRDVAALKAAILTNVDKLAALTTSTITGGRLNACRALGGTISACNSASAVSKRRRGQTTSE